MFIRLLQQLLKVALVFVERVHVLLQRHFVCLDVLELHLGCHQFTRFLLYLVFKRSQPENTQNVKFYSLKHAVV